MTANWKTNFRQSLKNTDDIAHYLDEDFAETPYSNLLPKALLKKIKTYGKDSPLGRQFLPNEQENNLEGIDDPIGDQLKSPAPGLVHRYSNRVLIFPTKVCPVHCRYCFRKNELNHSHELFESNLSEAFLYIQEHKEINEVILSGGDPLILSNEKIQTCLESLEKIEHIKFVRFHTRTPVILPERIDDDFLSTLKKFEKRFRLTFVIHINHRQEWDNQVRDSLKKLERFHLLSQSVLLNGVNNKAEDLKNLFEILSLNGVRPYYLHHPDKTRGTKHFWITIEEGKSLYKELRALVPGWMLPQYVIDSPNGKSGL